VQTPLPVEINNHAAVCHLLFFERDAIMGLQVIIPCSSYFAPVSFVTFPVLSGSVTRLIFDPDISIQSLFFNEQFIFTIVTKYLQVILIMDPSTVGKHNTIGPSQNIIIIAYGIFSPWQRGIGRVFPKGFTIGCYPFTCTLVPER
jgi:hypothetical protein